MATYQEQLDRLRQQREAREKAEAERKALEMTPDQITNWRGILRHMVGPYALIMPDSMVQEFRDRFQDRINDELSVAAASSESTKEKP